MTLRLPLYKFTVRAPLERAGYRGLMDALTAPLRLWPRECGHTSPVWFHYRGKPPGQPRGNILADVYCPCSTEPLYRIRRRPLPFVRRRPQHNTTPVAAAPEAGYDIPLHEQSEPQLRGTLNRLKRTHTETAKQLKQAMRAELKRRRT